MTLDEWVAIVSSELGVGPIDTTDMLDLARDVAHGVARPAAPITTLLVGLAVGSGLDAEDVISRVRNLIPPQ